MTGTSTTSRAVIFLAFGLVGSFLSSCASTPGRDQALDPVFAADICDDGQTMIVSTVTSEVATFDVSPLRFRALLTREETKTKPNLPTLTSPPIACSPASRILVAAGLGSEVVAWDVESVSPRFRTVTDAGVVGLAFYPDGHSFVTVGLAARLWNAGSGSILGDFTLPSDATATSVAVSPDGKVVLVGLSSGAITEFDAVSRRVTRTLKGHSVPVTGLAFSPDGLTFASTAGRFDPRIWNRTESSPVPRKFSGGSGIAESLEKARDDAQALALFAWLLGTVRGFQIVGAPTMGAAPMQSANVEQSPSPYCRPSVAYSPDGRFLAATAHISLLSGEFHLILGDMAHNEGRVISGIYGCSVAFTRDSKLVVTGGFGAPQLWNAETGARVENESQGR